MTGIKNRKTRLVYFSPTGTSKRTAEAVARGLGTEFERVDLTLPDAEAEKHGFKSDELAIIAVPVYGGRIPYTAVRRLKNVKGSQGPAGSSWCTVTEPTRTP